MGVYLSKKKYTNSSKKALEWILKNQNKELSKITKKLTKSNPLNPIIPFIIFIELSKLSDLKNMNVKFI